MISCGWILVVLGAVGIVVGLAMDVTVPGAGVFDRVANLSLMNQQSSILMLAGLSFLSGCVLIGFGTVNATLAAAFTSAPAPKAQSAAEVEQDAPVLAVGTIVRHPVYGEGVVDSVQDGVTRVQFRRKERPVRVDPRIVEVLHEAAPTEGALGV